MPLIRQRHTAEQQQGADNSDTADGHSDTGDEMTRKIIPAIDPMRKPNEAGRIMVVMFHNFIENMKRDKTYTTTLMSLKAFAHPLHPTTG